MLNWRNETYALLRGIILKKSSVYQPFHWNQNQLKRIYKKNTLKTMTSLFSQTFILWPVVNGLRKIMTTDCNETCYGISQWERNPGCKKTTITGTLFMSQIKTQDWTMSHLSMNLLKMLRPGFEPESRDWEPLMLDRATPSERTSGYGIVTFIFSCLVFMVGYHQYTVIYSSRITRHDTGTVLNLS